MAETLLYIEPRTHNCTALTAAIDEILSSISLLDENELKVDLSASFSLQNKEMSFVPVRMLLNAHVYPHQKVTLLVTMSLEDESKTVVCEYPGDFHIPEGEDYLENNPILTRITVIDPTLHGVGIGTILIQRMNEIRTALFRKYHPHIGVNRYFVVSTDMSNDGKPGWTSRRKNEAGAVPIDYLTFQQCVYIVRE